MADSRSSLQHILAAAPVESSASPMNLTERPSNGPTSSAPVPLVNKSHEENHGRDADPGISMVDGNNTETGSMDEPLYTSTTTSTRRNASGSVSSVYSGNKIKHLKKEDGIPLWRKDIQYDFLKLVFDDDTRAFMKQSTGTHGHTFAEIYIDAMAKSSKTSKILKEKLLKDQEGAVSMAMVCLLVNVGRMNTTLNFFPEMRAQLRTYHSIPALQAHQDPYAYKQLQDAPRLKSILKGATEDEPQPSSMEEIKAARVPRTNPVNLIFIMSQYAPKISEVHFCPPRDFFDLVMRGSLSSKTRATAFLWLIWWYLESDFSHEDSQRNPFGPGQYAPEDEEKQGQPLKVPPLESLTEEQAALENVDSEGEKQFGEIKRKERIAILASEPSPAMTALKRARREKELASGGSAHGVHVSDDEGTEASWWKNMSPRSHVAAASVNGSAVDNRTDGRQTRSPSPIPASSGFQAVNAPATEDMRINTLLNTNDSRSKPKSRSPPEVVPPPVAVPAVKKGPGRGNWRRNKNKNLAAAESSTMQSDPRHVPLLPNTAHYGFVNETPSHVQPVTPGAAHYHQYNSGFPLMSPNGPLHFHLPSTHPPSTREHIPTPSYQAQKRHRGPTQHQTAMNSHRRQQVNYNLDRRIRKVHAKSRAKRDTEGPFLHAWKRIRMMPPDYDSDEEAVKIRKRRDRIDKDEDFRGKGKENFDSYEDMEFLRRPRVLMAGFAYTGFGPNDIGEQAKRLATTFKRSGRRLDRYEDMLPGTATMQRKHLQLQQALMHGRTALERDLAIDRDGLEIEDDGQNGSRDLRQSGGRGRRRRSRSEMMDDAAHSPPGDGQLEQDDADGVGELDEEDRELLGEVDADETDEGDDDDDDY